MIKPVVIVKLFDRALSPEEIETEFSKETEELYPTFTRGEEIEIRKSSILGREKGIYYDTIPGQEYPYIAKLDGDSKYDFRKHIRKLPQVQETGPKKFTKEYIQSFVGKRDVPLVAEPMIDAIATFLNSHGMLEE